MILNTNIISEMWRIAENLIKGINSIWLWLNNPISLGFKIPVIGYVGVPKFIPIEIIGAGMIAFLVLWLIKGLVPFL